MNIVDIIIILMVILGAIIGFREGAIKRATSFLGTFLVFIIAFILKNPLSVVMYENLPFFKFGGMVKGIDIINILIYELLAFAVVAVALGIILRILIVITGFVEKLLKMTVILSIPSKIIGIFVGALEFYVYVFLILVFLNLPAFNIGIVRKSKFANIVINDTPVLNSIVGDTVDTYTEVYNIMHNNRTMSDLEINEVVLEMLLEKEMITVESTEKLINSNKLYIEDKSILDKYR